MTAEAEEQAEATAPWVALHANSESKRKSSAENPAAST